ncbi:2962_t:CDS:1 [Entrophospora sp. SA101]|nr:2962_t:CDS:1 [Entrophospora sp. SA101]CAJ0894796.1 62_t:CDS:1 [Entrophospora sp. SA101]
MNNNKSAIYPGTPSSLSHKTSVSFTLSEKKIDKNNIAYLLDSFNSIETFNKKEKHDSNGSNNLTSGNADGSDKNNIVNLLNSFTDLLDKKTDNDKSKKKHSGSGSKNSNASENVDGSDKNNMVNLLDSIADCFDKKTAKSKKEHGSDRSNCYKNNIFYLDEKIDNDKQRPKSILKKLNQIKQKLLKAINSKNHITKSN